ncbi:hypothetical protein Tco_0972080 [Tanacetum coccineum]
MSASYVLNQSQSDSALETPSKTSSIDMISMWDEKGIALMARNGIKDSFIIGSSGENIATVNEAVMNQTLNGVCRGIKSLLGVTILPINNKGTILVISIVKGYVQNEPLNQTLWLAYTYSMPPILSLPLSMACDDSDGSMAKGENSMWMLSVECDHVVGEQRQGWSASWRGNLTMLQLRPWQRLLLKEKIVNALKGTWPPLQVES